MRAERISHFDILRGVAILGVVFIHASTREIGFNDLGGYFTVIWRNFWNFSVPLFLAISGYFMANKNFGSIREYYTFLKKAVSRVILPYAIWSVIYSALKIKAGQSPTSVVLQFLSFQSNTVFYYVLLILQFYLFLPFLLRLANLRGLIISFIVSMLSVVGIYLIRYKFGIDLEIIAYGAPFFVWIMFFQLGMYLGKGNQFFISKSYLLPLIVFFLLASVGESFLITKLWNDTKESVSAVRLSSFIYSYFMLAFLMSRRFKQTRAANFFTQIGLYSFGIYLTHMLILPRIFSLLKRFPFFEIFGALSQIGAGVITLIICMVLGNIFHRTLNLNIVSRTLGF